MARSHSSCQLCRAGSVSAGGPTAAPGTRERSRSVRCPPRGPGLQRGHRGTGPAPQPLPRGSGRHRPGRRHQQHPRTFARRLLGSATGTSRLSWASRRNGSLGAGPELSVPRGRGCGPTEPGWRRGHGGARVRASIPPHLRYSARRYLQQDLLLAQERQLLRDRKSVV